ncbi:MAG: PBSX family phage terminase large subunit [Rhodospirillales bacterium]
MPKIQVPSKFLPVLNTSRRFVVIIGGRGSAKSESVGRFLTMKVQTESADILCGREFQSSIDDSVHKLLKTLIDETIELQGFSVLEQKIDCLTGGGFRFKGFARNSSAVKSAQGFKYSWIEEAQTLSKESIQDLTPTIRAAGSQLFFTANPKSSADPFSKRFIVPYLKELLRDGFYEDDMHLIVVMNWRDNPWHGELETERQWDLDNLPRAEYDHIWEGAFNDHIENALIPAEWFDAAIDAHIKLGFKAKGVKVMAHDPSDKGPDDKGLCYRHGSVVLDVQEKTGLDVNEGCDWAIDQAIEEQADIYVWDCDGLGASLRRQTIEAIKGKKIEHVEFRGGKGVDNPKEIYQKVDGATNKKAKTNEQTFKNRRAQYYWMLRDRFYNSYQAVEKGIYIDPDEMISLSSSISNMSALRAEVCRIPRKPNGTGLIQIMSKDEMARQKPPIPSPNMADSLMMSMAIPPPRKADTPLRFASVYGN